MDLTQLLELLIGVSLLTLIHISLFIYTLSRNVTRWGIALSGISSCIVLALLSSFGLLNSSTDQFRISSLIELLEAFSIPTIDLLSTIWIPLSALLCFLLLMWPQAPQTSQSSYNRETWAGLMLLAMTQILVISSNIWLQLSACVMAGWMLCLILGRETADGTRSRMAAASLIWLTIADLFWLLGLTTLELVLATSRLSQINHLESLSQFSAGQVAIAVTAMSLLLVSLLLRCGMYPLMSWTGPAALSLRDSAWIIGFGFGPGLLLLFRWFPILTFFPESCLLMAGVGALSAILLALIAWSDARLPARMVHLAASQVSLIWLGLAADPLFFAQLTSLALCGVWLYVVIAMSLCQLQSRSSDNVWGSRILMILAIVFSLGVFGQEQIFESIRQSTRLGGLNPYLLLGVALFSHTLVCWTLFRTIRFEADRVRSPDRNTLSVPGPALPVSVWLLLLASLGLCVTGLVFVSARLQPGEGTDFPIPVIGGLLTLISLVAAYTWPESIHSFTNSRDDRSATLRRLAQAEFYVPAFIHLGLLLPIRAAAQLSRFFEWVLIGQLVQKVPAGLVRRIGSQAAFADEEVTDHARMWQTLMALFVMLSGFAIGSWL